MSTVRLFVKGKLVLEKQPKPESEWTIDPIFLKGIGDDHKLLELIKEALKYRSSGL